MSGRFSQGDEIGDKKMRKALRFTLYILLISFSTKCFAIEVAVISRSALNQENSRSHLFILSDSLPKGVWEVGPDSKGKIISTNLMNDLQEWNTGVETYRAINSNSIKVDVLKVRVNKEGLLKAISLYEKSFVGMKYRKGDDNYAVIQTIYGAGGPKLDIK